MKLLSGAALVATMFLTCLTSAATIGQRKTEALYRKVSFYSALSGHIVQKGFKVFLNK
jgi:hypothetical protein